jgi:hypothetical protein
VVQVAQERVVRIQDAYANRQHAALFLEYFCPFGNSVRSVARRAMLGSGWASGCSALIFMSPDSLIIEFDRALRTVFATARTSRPTPVQIFRSGAGRSGAPAGVGLMRVNHCGEICAQALYQGQALTSRDPAVRDALRTAADEETEHLAWTESRIAELGAEEPSQPLVVSRFSIDGCLRRCLG